MDSVDRFLQLAAQACGHAPRVEVSGAVLHSLRVANRREQMLDYAPLAVSAALAIAAGVFFMVSLSSSLSIDTTVAELVNPISMLVP